MNSTPDTPPSPTPDPVPDRASDPPPKRFERSSRDRIIGGVCGGLGRYFGVDPTLVRIGMVALALLGGTGLIVYAAALILVPADDEVAPGPHDTRDRALAVGVAIVLTIIGFASGGFGLGGLFPIALLAVAGLAVWWFATGERPTGGPGQVVRRAAQGVGLLVGCSALAIGSFITAGMGGGVVVAALVIAAGVALLAAAFVGGARWLVLPAIAIALPLAFVSATGVDLDGGFGERHVRPGTLAEVKDSYKLGAGELVIDLRDVKLPAGDHRLKVGIGAGHALVLVPEHVCVASTAQVGMGGVVVFERDGGGVDVDWSDLRRAPADTARLVIDGDVGLGLLDVRHNDDDHDVPRRRFESVDANELNDSCATRVASRRSGASNG
ncbi:MAG TPA: PspC domain-containing protein [Solirubrobacteraceae bacterium]|jgi:phage shock protein PspC (stress-responsive transcriptional regulator)|nr:PspC domain-containing protein [Solirubrobacteraceae bacterium]